MTQEEKAKAYDEVRKKIAIRFGSNVADEIFFQFEMSEDEKIRKDLITYLKSISGDSLNLTLRTHDWLAWLEKQGEQKPDSGSFWEGYNTAKEKLKQKPVVIPKFKVGDIIKDTEDGEVFTIRTITKDKYIYTDDSFDWIKDQDEYELVEQKPTDEEMKELLHTEYEKGRADAIEEMQNPAWSEEDCNQIESIACHLDNIGNGAMAELLLNIMYKYKSHRPQSYWKPSDEQIKALEYYIYGHSPTATITKGTVWGNAIVGLLEQLKKLREEQL